MFVDLQKAVEILRASHVVAMPTETVYGLAGRIDSESAIREIFSVKKRPFFDPLIIHVCNLEQARSLCSAWPLASEVLAEKFWPGPLTLVLPKAQNVNPLITSGLESVGLRWPSHPLATRLIKEFGFPLAAPSANLFGRTSPTRADHVETEFSGQVPVLDGGPCEVGIESTVVMIQEVTQSACKIAILREGQITFRQIDETLKNKNLSIQWMTSIEKQHSPGHLKHHYMPNVPLVYCRRAPPAMPKFCNLIGKNFNSIPDQIEGVMIKKARDPRRLAQLVLSSDPQVAAREVYHLLRQASLGVPDAIYFVEPEYFIKSPENEDWKALQDRLIKAASLVLDEELA